MLSIFKKKTKIVSPMSGEIKPLSAVGDEVFAKELVGKGVAIQPTDGEVLAPVAGKLLQVFPTKHAYAIVSHDGIEVLIHCGIDTVELNGEGFVSHKKAGDMVMKGELIATMDLDYIKAQGKPLITPIIITNHDSFKAVNEHYGKASKGKTLMIDIEK